MLTKKELGIIELFRNDIFASYTIRKIMKKLDTRSYNWVYNAVMKLNKEGIISICEVGKSSLCSINMDEQRTISYLSILEENNSGINKIPNLGKIKKILPWNTHMLIIAGSYAAGSFTKKSDIDVIVIVGSKEEEKPIMNLLVRKGELMIPPIHPYVFTPIEFLEMLANSEENYGKEIFRKHLIIYGAELYYFILREAISRGFKG